MKLRPTSITEALDVLVAHLRDVVRRSSPERAPGEELDLGDVIRAVLMRRWKDEERASNPGMVRIEYDLRTNATAYYDAAWELVHRGLIRPSTVIDQQRPPYLAGLYFAITEYGRKWLSESDPVDCLPTDYSRFGQLLANHARRFGLGYQSRSQEAVASYRARTYLASCVMCGAAAESILLAIAVAKRGDESAVLADYRGGSGRSRIANYVMSQQNGVVQQTLPKFLELLTYWRDDAAHGLAVSIGEEEAFTSLLLLMRFARFADERWAEIAVSS